MARLDTRTYNYSLFAVSICVALIVGEIICRLALPRPGFTPFSGNWLPDAVMAHPTRLYQFRPNYSARLSGGSYGQMSIEINSLGLRERPVGELRRFEIRILAVGDSLTFGIGISREQAWPAQLEQALHEQLPSLSSSTVVMNGGIPGYNLAQIRDLTEELLSELSPQLIIVGVFAGGFDRLADPYSALGNLVVRQSEIPRIQLVENGVIRSNIARPSLAAFDLWLDRHSYIGAFLFQGIHTLYVHTRALLNSDNSSDSSIRHHQPLASRVLREGFEQIREMHKTADDRGIRLIVIPIVTFDSARQVYQDESLTAAAIREWCAAENISTFDPTPELERSTTTLRLNPDDYHWPTSAQAIVGQELASYLLTNHVLEGPARKSP